ncbi:Uncharacterised protein [Acinetobacter baumannii]|uniref:hypothetical protein n=1 Tax=Acinetobacter calcoaceticus/baumannii complex TaxID=909768 RepID=UPI0003DFA0C4|nr:hypothetical protein M211_1553 [Acinetobacter lactucae]SSS37987.1 Uncharacterised protein [Acinetobacter baumannii]
MSKFADDYRMTYKEIEELRQDTKEALKSPAYLALLSQIKKLDLSKVGVLGVYTYINRTLLIITVANRTLINESDIATAAANILRESFIKAARTEKVLYVENDILWSKTPYGQPVFIKQLTGRNFSLSKEITNRKVFKIKKRYVNTSIN